MTFYRLPIQLHDHRKSTVRQLDAVVVDVKEVVDLCLIRSVEYNVKIEETENHEPTVPVWHLIRFAGL